MRNGSDELDQDDWIPLTGGIICGHGTDERLPNTRHVYICKNIWTVVINDGFAKISLIDKILGS